MPMKIFFVAALLPIVASAMACSEGTCANDETSLVQKVQVVKHGVDRAPAKEADSGWDLTTGMADDVALPPPYGTLVTGATPVHDYDAIVDAMPSGIDAGRVMDAFGTNEHQIRNEIEDKAADDIIFTSSQRAKRRLDKKEADDKVKADSKAVADAKAKAQAGVDAVQKQRDSIISQAKTAIKEAKQEAEALHIKAAQAESAARLGRKVGVIEGNDAATNAWADYKQQVRDEEEKKARARAEARITARQKAIRDAANARTKALEKQDQARIKAAVKASTMAKAKSAAAAAKKETDIEGPEGLNNRITKLKAKWAVEHYEREAKEAQKKIKQAASGDFPPGDWPIGP